MAVMGPRPWRKRSSTQLTDHRIFSLRRDTVVSPRTGREHEFVVVESLDWVSVMAFDLADRLIMVRQYRHGIGEVTLELPGGIVDGGLSPEKAARSELRQESGYVADAFVELAVLAPIPALFNNRLHVFLARGARPAGELQQDEAEDIQVELRSLDQIRHLIRSGELINAQMIASVYAYELWCEDKASSVAPGEE